jgi:hypothetical protein
LATRARLVFMPDELQRKAAADLRQGSLSFVAAKAAVAVDILLIAPLRPQNLISLNWRRHFKEAAGSTGALSLLIPKRELEGGVLGGLKTRLMAPELVRAFIDTFQKEANRAAAERQQAAEQSAGRPAGVEREIAALVTAIENGRHSTALADRLGALEAEQAKLPPGSYAHPPRTAPPVSEGRSNRLAPCRLAAIQPAS